MLAKSSCQTHLDVRDDEALVPLSVVFPVVFVHPVQFHAPPSATESVLSCDRSPERRERTRPSSELQNFQKKLQELRTLLHSLRRSSALVLATELHTQNLIGSLQEYSNIDWPFFTRGRVLCRQPDVPGGLSQTQ